MCWWHDLLWYLPLKAVATIQVCAGGEDCTYALDVMAQ